MDIFSQVPVVSGFLLQEVSRYLMHSAEFLKIPWESFLRQQNYKDIIHLCESQHGSNVKTFATPSTWQQKRTNLFYEVF
ncbi:hypothetical protein ABPG74_011687 [Tetrahymena malaccensis]